MNNRHSARTFLLDLGLLLVSGCAVVIAQKVRANRQRARQRQRVNTICQFLMGAERVEPSPDIAWGYDGLTAWVELGEPGHPGNGRVVVTIDAHNQPLILVPPVLKEAVLRYFQGHYLGEVCHVEVEPPARDLTQFPDLANRTHAF